MLKLAAQPYLMFAEHIKTFGWWKKAYVTIFGKKTVCVDSVADVLSGIETVCTTEFRQMKNGNMYVMSEKYEQIKMKG